jgi:hypothetical protein
MFLAKPKRESPDPSSIREIYIDETSQTKHRYLLLGAVTLPLLKQSAAVAAIEQARVPELPKGEMKWGKVSPSKLVAYCRVVNAFFEHRDMHDAHFHCIVIDTSRIDDKHFNEGSREIGFNKEIYQLASKCARLYPSLFHLYPDRRETTQRPEELRQILNSGRRKQGDRRDWPFRRCQFRDSKTTPLLQMTDILLGSVAYQVNQHDRAANASQAKQSLSLHVLKSAGVADPLRDTTVSGKFTIWHRQLKASVPRP